MADYYPAWFDVQTGHVRADVLHAAVTKRLEGQGVPVSVMGGDAFWDELDSIIRGLQSARPLTATPEGFALIEASAAEILCAHTEGQGD